MHTASNTWRTSYSDTSRVQTNGRVDPFWMQSLSSCNSHRRRNRRSTTFLKRVVCPSGFGLLWPKYRLPSRVNAHIFCTLVLCLLNLDTRLFPPFDPQFSYPLICSDIHHLSNFSCIPLCWFLSYPKSLSYLPPFSKRPLAQYYSWTIALHFIIGKSWNIYSIHST